MHCQQLDGRRRRAGNSVQWLPCAATTTDGQRLQDGASQRRGDAGTHGEAHVLHASASGAMQMSIAAEYAPRHGFILDFLEGDHVGIETSRLGSEAREVRAVARERCAPRRRAGCAPMLAAGKARGMGGLGGDQPLEVPGGYAQLARASDEAYAPRAIVHAIRPRVRARARIRRTCRQLWCHGIEHSQGRATQWVRITMAFAANLPRRGRNIAFSNS